MRIWKVLPALPEHIPAIAANMREADRREVWASHRYSPAQALEGSLASSELAWTCFIDGKPSIMGGVARRGSLMSYIGAPWMLSTPDILRVTRDFIRYCRAYVRRMQTLFPRLENFVHTENSFSIRWLTWCGFIFSDVPRLINGEDFFLFWRESHA